MGGTIYILAGNVHNWQVQHNVLHHTYEYSGHDEDLDAGRIVLQKAKWHSFHRFQQYCVYGINFQLGNNN
jgi:linoleoyl-CoA desaturase